MATSGKKHWPPMGRTQWPLTGGPLYAGETQPHETFVDDIGPGFALGALDPFLDLGQELVDHPRPPPRPGHRTSRVPGCEAASDRLPTWRLACPLANAAGRRSPTPPSNEHGLASEGLLTQAHTKRLSVPRCRNGEPLSIARGKRLDCTVGRLVGGELGFSTSPVNRADWLVQSHEPRVGVLALWPTGFDDE